MALLTGAALTDPNVRWIPGDREISQLALQTRLVRRIRKHFDAIIAAIRLGLSNSRLEGINARIRLIQRRGFGIRDVDSLTSMIYLCLGGISIDLPTERR